MQDVIIADLTFSDLLLIGSMCIVYGTGAFMFYGIVRGGTYKTPPKMPVEKKRGKRNGYYK
jgi:hypothetical protein